MEDDDDDDREPSRKREADSSDEGSDGEEKKPKREMLKARDYKVCTFLRSFVFLLDRLDSNRTIKICNNFVWSYLMLPIFIKFSDFT